MASISVTGGIAMMSNGSSRGPVTYTISNGKIHDKAFQTTVSITIRLGFNRYNADYYFNAVLWTSDGMVVSDPDFGNPLAYYVESIDGTIDITFRLDHNFRGKTLAKLELTQVPPFYTNQCYAVTNSSGNSIYISSAINDLFPPTNVHVNYEPASTDEDHPNKVGPEFYISYDQSIHSNPADVRYELLIDGINTGYSNINGEGFYVSDATRFLGSASTPFVIRATCGLDTIETDDYYISLINLTKPTNVRIVQNNNNTLTITWNPSTVPPRTGTIYYSVLTYNDGMGANEDRTINVGTGTSITISIPNNNIPYESNLSGFRIVASCAGIDVESDFVLFRVHTPTITMTNIEAITGNGVIISWDPAVQSYSSGRITYHIKIGSESWKTTNDTSYRVQNPARYTQDTTVYVYATDTYATSNTVSVVFKYAGTIKYRNNNNEWIDCLMRYFNGTEWVDCVAKYFDGHEWNGN